jgi:hypothetical protein
MADNGNGNALPIEKTDIFFHDDFVEPMRMHTEENKAFGNLHALEHHMLTHQLKTLDVYTQTGQHYTFSRNEQDELCVTGADGKSVIATTSSIIATSADKNRYLASPMLAMEWMDNSKGDIRAIVCDGKVIGMYKRVATRYQHGDTPHAMPVTSGVNWGAANNDAKPDDTPAQDWDTPRNSWKCNVAQGGKVVPVRASELTKEDKKRLKAIAKGLSDLGIQYASIDLLCNSRGERMLSEINIGNADDIVEVHKFHSARSLKSGTLDFPDLIAAELLDGYRREVAKGIQKAS